MPIPHRPLFWLCSAWFVFGLAVVFMPALFPWWQGMGIAMALVAIADLLAGRRRLGQVEVEREISRTLPVGTWQLVKLRLTTRGGNVSGWLYDQHPRIFQGEDQPLAFQLAPGRWIKLGYRILITERGMHVFEAVRLRLASPLGLWLISEVLPVRSEVQVFPNFSRIVRYTLLATDHRLSQMGILRRRRRGEGMEFHQLRDYCQDDSPRQVDWKASARMGKLISREYEDERDQQVVFLLDCGCRMRTRDGELSHFDHTLNALLLLAYAVLRQGDAVGMATFAHGAPRYLPPKKSISTVQQLLKTSYDLQPGLDAPDYLEAVSFLLRRLSKRALVILVTNMRDEDDATIGAAMSELSKRHAVSLVSLREPVLEQLVQGPVSDFEGALTRAAALEYIQARRRQVAVLRHKGVQVVESSPRELPEALVNHYWARKRAGNL